MVREAPAEPPPPPLDADKVRGGKIILRTSTERVIFIAGLAGAVLLVIVLMLIR